MSRLALVVGLFMSFVVTTARGQDGFTKPEAAAKGAASRLSEIGTVRKSPLERASSTDPRVKDAAKRAANVPLTINAMKQFDMEEKITYMKLGELNLLRLKLATASAETLDAIVAELKTAENHCRHYAASHRKALEILTAKDRSAAITRAKLQLENFDKGSFPLSSDLSTASEGMRSRATEAGRKADRTMTDCLAMMANDPSSTP